MSKQCFMLNKYKRKKMFYLPKFYFSTYDFHILYTTKQCN